MCVLKEARNLRFCSLLSQMFQIEWVRWSTCVVSAVISLQSHAVQCSAVQCSAVHPLHDVLPKNCHLPDWCSRPPRTRPKNKLFPKCHLFNLENYKTPWEIIDIFYICQYNNHLGQYSKKNMGQFIAWLWCVRIVVVWWWSSSDSKYI